MTEQLSHCDRIAVFRLATRSLAIHHTEAVKSGMTNEELECALADCLGIFGGSGGPDRLSVSFKGAGLKIWGGWHNVNHVSEPPLFEGKQTLAMAREVYGIPDPQDNQLSLF